MNLTIHITGLDVMNSDQVEVHFFFFLSRILKNFRFETTAETREALKNSKKIRITAVN